MPFVHDEDFSTPDYGLEDIAGCDDVPTLLRWYEETQASHGDIKAQVDAALACETYDDDWMERTRSALGFAGMGVSRLRQRLRKFGVDPEMPPGEFGDLVRLQRGLAQSKENIAKAKASATFGRHLLSAMREALPKATVDAITAEAATRAAADAESIAA